MSVAERRVETASRLAPLFAGVDVGGTKVAALVVDREGTVLGRAVRSMSERGPAASMTPVVAAVRAALDAADANPADLVALGIGVPGRVDRRAGVVLVASNLGWVNVPLAAVVEGEIGAPCRIENDVRLAAAGLVDHEVARGATSLAYVAVGTGIGAGLVLDGVVHRGGRGSAGEIGHVIVEPDGVPCSCGQRGCLETIASGPAVLRTAEAALAEGVPSVLRLSANRTAKTVYDAARAGDELALSVVNHAGRVLAHSILGLVLTCDVERVLIGGGVAAAGAVFLDPIVAELARLREASPLVDQLVGPETVRLLPAQFDAVAWGGVAEARRVAQPDSRGAEAGSRIGERESRVAEPEGRIAERDMHAEGQVGQVHGVPVGAVAPERDGHADRPEEVVARDTE